MNHEETTKSMIDLFTKYGISHAVNHLNMALSLLFMSISVHLVYTGDLHLGITVFFGSAIYGSVIMIKNKLEKVYDDKSQLSYEIRLYLAAYVYLFYTIAITEILHAVVMYP